MFSIPPAIRREEVRLVIFNAEQDHRPVYDSETVIHLADGLYREARRSKCGQFQFLRHRKDVTELARLVFGTLSTSVKKGSLKIHTIDNFSLVLSRVFSVPKDTKLNTSTESTFIVGSYGSDLESNPQCHATIRSLDALYRDDQSIRESTIGGYKNSVDPPTTFACVRNYSLQLDSFNYDELRSVLSPHHLSRAKRKQLSQRGLAEDPPRCWGSRSRLSSCSSMNDQDDNGKQVGFALVFSLEEKEFIFQHIIQVEEEIAMLEFGIRAAVLTSRIQFFQNVYTAYRRFCSSICILHNSQRLRTPVWLSLMDPTIQIDTASSFCNELADLVEKLDKRETNFFISTLLSAVLMNHLAWVASVAPPDSLPDNPHRSMLIGTNVVDGPERPYNANMAQFLELCGNIGPGCRMTKTVIVGPDSKLINQILFVLSYFIRCSNVEVNEPPTNLSPQPTASSCYDNDLSPPLTDEMDDCVQNDSVECPINTSTSFSEKRRHTSLKRHSYSISASSPPEVSSYVGQVCPSSLTEDSQILNDPSDLDYFEPPTKTRVVCAQEFKCLKPTADSNSIKLLMDVKDVTSASNELITSTFSPSFPSSTQSSAPPISISPSNSSSSHTISSSLSSPSSELGRSLLAGVCESYSPHFIISGIQSDPSRTEEISSHVYEDVKRHSMNRQPWCPHSTTPSNPSHHQSPTPNSGKFSRLNTTRLSESAKSPPQYNETQSRTSVIDECLPTVVVVIGDLNKHTIRAVTSDEQFSVEDQLIITPSEAIINTLEQFLALHQMNSDPNFLISFFEDQLGSILAKSHTLVELVTSCDTTKMITEQLHQMQAFTKLEHNSLLKINRNRPDPTEYPNNMDTSDSNEDLEHELDSIEDPDAEDDRQRISMQKVSKVIGCDCSDLRLILNVAAIYNPSVLMSIL